MLNIQVGFTHWTLELTGYEDLMGFLIVTRTDFGLSVDRGFMKPIRPEKFGFWDWELIFRVIKFSVDIAFLLSKIFFTELS